MNQITRDAMLALRADLDAAVRQVGERHGLKIQTGRATFSAECATFKVEVATIGQSGTVQTKEASAFKQLAQAYGLKAEHLGASFDQGGKTYTITGLKTKAHAYPILAKGQDGKTYKFPVEMVRRALNA
jgi:hypothetical protein